MVKIPDQHIHSIEMIQKYPNSSNGTTVIRYYMEPGDSKFSEDPIETTASHIFFDMLCEIGDDFKVTAEGQFFVKESAYRSNTEYEEAVDLAIADNLRFQLYHNLLNASTCPEISKASSFIAKNYQNFYQSFVTEGRDIDTIFYENNPLNRTSECKLPKKSTEPESRETQTYNESSFLSNKAQVENYLKVVFEKIMNVIFIPTSYEEQANLIIYLNDVDSIYTASDKKLYKNDKISQMKLLLTFASEDSLTSTINDYIHGTGHIFLDHPCENYYPCSKGSMQTTIPNLLYRTVMSQQNTQDVSEIATSVDENSYQLIQSFLPWDIAALRHSYGMPKPENVTYHLNNNSALNEAFAIKLLNTTLIALPSIGYNALNATYVKAYAIDLRYDHLSNITNDEISFRFLLSYDTEIAEIFVNTAGNIILNSETKAQVFISSDHIVIYSETEEACLPNDAEEIAFIRICNYNESLHDVDVILA